MDTSTNLSAGILLCPPGIWDCLSSQQAVDIVRRQLAERKSLQEVCEFTIQKCCAPDADTGAGIGCDNMTMILVAILNGRTLDQWYDWIANRVGQKVGYATPTESPQIFAESRILAAQQRAAFRGSNSTGFNTGGLSLRGPGGFGALARVLGGGGISFHPASKRNGEHTVITFDDNDDDEYEYEYEDEEDVGDTGEGGLFGVNRLKVGGASNNTTRDVTKSLRDQLDELEDEIEEDGQGSHKSEPGSSRADESTKNTGGLPRATINLPSPSERQGMINLNIADEGDEGEPPEPTKFLRLSGPTRPFSSSTGSPLIPTPSVLANFGRRPSPGGAKVNGRAATTPPRSPSEHSEEEDEVPPQETGRVPDADAKAVKGQGLTNGLLDKSEEGAMRENKPEGYLS